MPLIVVQINAVLLAQLLATSASSAFKVLPKPSSGALHAQTTIYWDLAAHCHLHLVTAYCALCDSRTLLINLKPPTTNMPPQHVEIAETLAAVKRALKREREGEETSNCLPSSSSTRVANISPHSAPTPQPIAAASNRGNKLEPGAKYVHEGALAFMNGSDVYKQVC